MGSNAKRTGNPADRMGGRTLGWGTREENKTKRKEMRSSANDADIETGLDEYHTYWVSDEYKMYDPCYCNDEWCYTCGVEFSDINARHAAKKKKKKKGCKGKEKPHQFEPFARTWEYGNGLSTTSHQFKCKVCGKLEWRADKLT